MTADRWDARLATVTVRRAPDGPQAGLAVVGHSLAVLPELTHPRVFRALTGRRHPEIRRIRQLYRAKRGRGW